MPKYSRLRHQIPIERAAAHDLDRHRGRNLDFAAEKYTETRRQRLLIAPRSRQTAFSSVGDQPGRH